MKRLFNVRIVTLTVMLVMGAITVTAVGRSQSIGLPRQSERAIAITGTGSSIPIFDAGGGPPIGANVTGSGRALDLGLWTAVGELQFTYDSDPNISYESGSVTFTADNGDQLKMLVDGVANFTTKLTQGTGQFAGGTGRFSNASGTVNLIVWHNFQTGAFEVWMVGKIIY